MPALVQREELNVRGPHAQINRQDDAPTLHRLHRKETDLQRRRRLRALVVGAPGPFDSIGRPMGGMLTAWSGAA